jgi:hypothetical protein
MESNVETAVEESAVAEEPVAEEPVAEEPVNIRKDVVIESSLVFLSHPDIVKLVEGVAARKSKAYRGNPKGILKSIRSGASEDGAVVWKPGDIQQVEGVDKLEMSSYTLEFDEPIRIVDFYEAILRSGNQYSFLHFRRPGDPLGRDVRKIQNIEDSADRAKGAAAAAAPAPEAPATAKAAMEELEKPVEQDEKMGVKEINPSRMTDNVLDENLNVIKTSIQKDIATGGAFADFYMITGDGFFKAYRARGKNAGEVEQYIKKFLANPAF